MEALLGAVHLEHGMEVARAVVLRLFDPLMAQALNRGAGLDWKTSLQELAAAESWPPPTYVVTETGPDHAKAFTATVHLGGSARGAGTGASKKEAELHAAAQAWTALRGTTL